MRRSEMVGPDWRLGRAHAAAKDGVLIGGLPAIVIAAIVGSGAFEPYGLIVAFYSGAAVVAIAAVPALIGLAWLGIALYWYVRFLMRRHAA